MRATAEEVLEEMIRVLKIYLDELQDVKDVEEKQFQYGEKTAYVECLEIVQYWERAEEFGLDFEIEKRYAL